MFLAAIISLPISTGSRSGTPSSLVTKLAGRKFGAGLRWHSRHQAMFSGCT